MLEKKLTVNVNSYQFQNVESTEMGTFSMGLALAKIDDVTNRTDDVESTWNPRDHSLLQT